ncbi:alpha-ketoglutarate-dependent dioxygenase alkB homolog 6 isoform X2 [Stomoxys calcitrans]|uniref:alpha-ketoglutarate-dependent dioxygenase alkB homolog 6 isoform X2 n=1 Tax=Stomoxys calcitrans TaxID=35570 RepID=UPI0027E3594C|nr:alpha-ketoglutarate-dependent dioxygenase alkB homolog 6 isoform X2 [Stomoxys calcitrans]
MKVKCPSTAMYIPNFITSEEEQRILAQIEKAPKPKWTQLMNRRLINYGGVPHPNGMIAEEIPEWLQTYVDKINNLGIFEAQKANHVLVNEYKPGQGIMPHTDGPLFFPLIMTISCGSHTVLEFSKRENLDSTSIGENHNGSAVPRDSSRNRAILFKFILEPRSLLILKDELYIDYLHSIDEVEADVLCDRICNFENCESSYKMGDVLKRGTRISLTIRNVPKATKMKLKFC